MPIPRIAIVGRPNAGKSSLMNMIAGAKVSIVDPTPGVTRDRVATIVDLQPPDNQGPVKPAEFIDTGGFGVYTAEGKRFDEVGSDLSRLTESIEFQIAQAIESADLILLAVDCQQGLTPSDEQIARMLREGAFGRRSARARRSAEAKSSKGTKAAKGAKEHRLTTDDHGASRIPPKPAPPIHVVGTKCDGPKWETHAMELAGLGFGEPLMCSAMNNYMRREFLDRVYELLPEPQQGDTRPVADLMLAIIGKRNAGKSTLVNTMAGEQRVIVSEIAGTTRDAVDVRFDFGGRSLVAIDTAGLRRKKSFQDAVEHYAYDRAQKAIERADVVLMLLDAAEKISQVDEHLAALAQKSYKPVIVVVNKWDLAEGRADAKGRQATPQRYEEYIRRELNALWFAPIAFIEAQNGRNVREVIDLAFEIKEQSEERVTTGKLNRLVRGIVERRGPTDTKGTFAKVFYVAQTGIAPPTITLVVNHPELFRPNYIRFLMNRFREELPFKEVPIRLVVRARRQREGDLGVAAEAEEKAARARGETPAGKVRITRGVKGGDTRSRQRAEELKSGAPARGRGEIPSDDELLAEFDRPGSPPLSDEDEAMAREMLSGTEEFETGYDDAVEGGKIDDSEFEDEE